MSVQLSHLSIGYVTGGQQHVVASDIDASLRSGEMTCLLGQNGIGKSTLLRTLAAFQPRLDGDIFINGRSIDSYSRQQIAQEIGVVLTERPDVRNMTVGELVGMGRSPYTGFWGSLSDEDHRIVDEAIAQTGISSLAGRLTATLSDGERQKVMIAKTLAQQTSVIFLDEPTAFLDFPSKVEMLQLLRRLARQQQKTIFLSTHDVELALQLADQLWLMEPGLLSVGTPRQLAAQGVLTRFLERDGISFDTSALTVRVTQESATADAETETAGSEI